MPVTTRALGDKLLALAKRRHPGWSLDDVNKSFKALGKVVDATIDQWLAPGDTTIQLRGKGKSERVIEDWLKRELGVAVHRQWYTCPLLDADTHIAEQTFGVWKWDAGSAERSEAIEGTYQIIRPFNQRHDRYVLEAMMITPVRSEILGPKNLMMYSHNEPRRECLYDGQLLIGNRFAFGMLQRPHETEPRSRSAMRGVGLYIDSKSKNQKTGEFAGRYCLTGIIIRGVSAKTADVSKNVVAVPFAAIRPEVSICDLRTPNFQPVKKTLWTLGNGYLVGRLHGNMAPNVFALCKSVLDALKPQIQKDYALHTVPPVEVEDVFQVDTADDDSAFQKWRQAVAQDLAAA